jgi:hypothetical protein
MMARMGGAMLSDEDEKEGIKRIGESESGPYDRPTKMDEGMLSGLMSDRHSKEQIQRLEGANQALASALRPAYPDTAAPSSGMQALGQQQPDNNATRVAKQNQVLSEGSPFAVGMQQPNLDELDEAYKRLGQGG